MSLREIVGHVRDLYGPGVSPALISAVTDAAPDEVAAWQARPLEPTYPLVFSGALRARIRDEGAARNKAVHIALGVRADGTKEILGPWLEQNEGAKFWLRVMNELRNRGVEDIFMAVVDGLKGFPDAIRARVSGRHDADLHCPPAAQQPRFRQLQGPKIRRHGLEGHHLRGRRRGRRDVAHRLRGERPGPKIPRHRPKLATRLARGDPVLRLPGRGQADCLHGRTRSRSSTPSCAAPSAPGAISPATTPRPSCCVRFRSAARRSGPCWREHGPWPRLRSAVIFGERFIKAMA
jgi:hypothetical protein